MNKLPNETIEFIENLGKLVNDVEHEIVLCAIYRFILRVTHITRY